MGENAFAQRSQLLEQRIWKGAPKDGAGKQIENVHHRVGLLQAIVAASKWVHRS